MSKLKSRPADSAFTGWRTELWNCPIKAESIARLLNNAGISKQLPKESEKFRFWERIIIATTKPLQLIINPINRLPSSFPTTSARRWYAAFANAVNIMSVGKVCGYVQISVARRTNTGGISAAQNGTLQAFSGSGDTLWMTASDAVFHAHHKSGFIIFRLRFLTVGRSSVSLYLVDWDL